MTIATKERPILFSGPMVRALLAGMKTMTRRIVKPQPTFAEHPTWTHGEGHRGIGWYVTEEDYHEEGSVFYRCPYGAPGDRLWVRESFYIDLFPYSEVGPLPKERPKDLDDRDVYYRADGECCSQIPECCCAEVGKPRWRRGIHMPRWACRIVLEITDVRVQRVQDISDDDARAEGHPPTHSDPDPIAWFRALWETINGAGAWDRNGWVWALTFKRVQS